MVNGYSQMGNIIVIEQALSERKKGLIRIYSAGAFYAPARFFLRREGYFSARRLVFTGHPYSGLRARIIGRPMIRIAAPAQRSRSFILFLLLLAPILSSRNHLLELDIDQDIRTNALFDFIDCHSMLFFCQ
jgi:hypothetical protein